MGFVGVFFLRIFMEIHPSYCSSGELNIRTKNRVVASLLMSCSVLPNDNRQHHDAKAKNVRAMWRLCVLRSENLGDFGVFFSFSLNFLPAVLFMVEKGSVCIFV